MSAGRAVRIGLFLIASICASGIQSGAAYAATYCTVRYTFLGVRDSSYVFLRQLGNDCVATSLLWLVVKPNGATSAKVTNWESGYPDDWTRGLEATWELVEPGTSHEMLLASTGWRIVAPDTLHDPTADLRAKREPVCLGISAIPIYWEGGGKYLNYGVKDVFFDQERGLLLLITHSEWEEDKVGYSLGEEPGDGIVVMRITDQPH